MRRRRFVFGICALLSLLGCLQCAQVKTPADIVLKNCKVYTMEESRPWAGAVIITGNKITEVLDDAAEADSYVGPQTRVVDLEGAFVTPGFIDAHTHFDGFGAIQNDIDLMPVVGDEGLVEELKRVVNNLDPEDWIVGGAWDGHRLWNADWREREQLKINRWEPDRRTIENITADNPCFLWSWDEDLYLANAAALKEAGLENARLEGMKLDGDRLTGLIYAGSPAIDVLKNAVKPKSEVRILNEMRAGLRKLAESGIVEIHDITPMEYVPRYVQLQKNGELTCRVWMRPDLSEGDKLKETGLKMNVHPETRQRDHYLRFGALKGYIDGLMGSHGALLFEPYTDRPETYGHYRSHSSDDPDGFKTPNLEKLYNLMKTGVEAGYILNTHAIGDRGIAICLDVYERLAEEFGKEKIARSRVIHAQTVRPQDFARFKPLDIIAESTPSNVPDDLRWIVRRLGPERERLSHPYKKFLDEGIVFLVGTDIPGAQGATFPCHPRCTLHACVNRTTYEGEPEGGWLPEYKISVEDVIRAYTIEAAYSVFDEDVRGSIEPGKLADITVWDSNLIEIDPLKLLEVEVKMTIVDGRVVFEEL